ncbi:2,3-diaminopropionate biosynthesis protein SbnB [Solihabitans fulvus]|uniref:2,3-diaminopropionate biosynthesis protein SbnB n=1 Tax=Solihabitans fulvus TaxID=1892852 RepID=A0A5B2WL05_9PSEU|nr:2,3-diaminopropionate biosynthesis protein SbnB [Solihabitans fulvus]KAA2252713.1 2,3-diaminopropionate biosynthesis protein SbnB [Solihabitans fulvus]
MFEFSVISGSVVSDLLRDHEKEVVALVERAYLTHDSGASVNPDSYFLRFPEKPDSRIIALPAYLGGDVDLAGLKWIASFPGNVRSGRPRASAVLILNDYATGYPIALLEAAGISAARTAASAALAATALGGSAPRTVGVVGAGVIARTICAYLSGVGVPMTDVRCHDLDAASATALTGHLRERGAGEVRAVDLAGALECDLVVLATTAGTPYITEEHAFRPGQLVLNVSLRDLAPQLLLRANNVLDDVEHCMKANTSPHLAEQLTGNRDFVTGTLAGVLTGRDRLDPDLPTIFSPFGLGVLDLAVGHYVHQQAKAQGRVVEIPDFFGETARW